MTNINNSQKKPIRLNSNVTNFVTSFGGGGFQRNLFSFENKSNLQKLI